MRLLASHPIVSKLTAVAYLVYVCTVSAAKRAAAVLWRAARRSAAALSRGVAVAYPVLVLLLGLALVALGAALIYPPAGLIVAGLGLVLIAVDLMRDDDGPTAAPDAKR